MKTLVHNNCGGLGGFTFLMALMYALKQSGDTVHVCDRDYGWLAIKMGVADDEQPDPLASGYDRVLKPDMTRPDTVFEQSNVPRIPVPKLPLQEAVKSNVLAIIPYTQWGLWPLANWRAVITQLLNKDNFFNGVIVVLDGRYDFQAHTLAAKSVTITRQPLKTLATTLSSCRGWIAAQGGIGHLCAAMGIPGVMIRRYGLLPQWKPNQPWVTSIEGQGTGYAGVTPDSVVTAIKKSLGNLP